MAVEKISLYYLELERLLDRIRFSENHYQTLGLDPSATKEEVIRAYREVIMLLRPSDPEIAGAIPPDILKKIEQAAEKVSQAYSVLANLGKRVAYHNLLFSKSVQPLPVDIPESFPEKSSGQAAEDETKAPRAIPIGHILLQQQILTKPASEATASDRRRTERIKLSIPVRVVGHDRIGGKWDEMTHTIDVSRFGVAIRLQRRVTPGLVLHLTLPLPTRLRCYGYAEPTYRVYAIVRRVELPKDSFRVVGLEFLGQNPPPGYFEKPSAIFKTKWNGPERRREPRQEVSDAVTIEYLGEYMQSLRKETAVTENISRGGARILVRSAPAECELVKVTYLNRNFESLAAVCNRYVGQDGFERLCLRFLSAPLQLE
jgi:hypothetical protein